MLKVLTIVGTRPEIIRLSRVIPALDSSCIHTLVHTGQNYDYELNSIFFDELSIRRPDVFLDAAGRTPAETIGQVISKIDEVLIRFVPDAVLILGDTNSALAAISAKRRRIPLFHMEAGNRSYDQRVPEEINRRIVDHISDINLTYSRIARECLLREGLPPDQIIKIGSPMYEVLQHYMPQIRASNVLSSLNLVPKSYFLVSAHREENIESNRQFLKLTSLLNQLAEIYQVPVIVSTHPRTQVRIDSAGSSFHPNVRLLRPLGFFDYVCLQLHSKAVLSDSGTITEESSLLSFPALNIRESHERPEGMEEAAVMMVGLETDRIFQALSILEQQQIANAHCNPTIVSDYQAPNVSQKVVKIIHSYTDYVNRTVWKQY